MLQYQRYPGRALAQHDERAAGMPHHITDPAQPDRQPTDSSPMETPRCCGQPTRGTLEVDQLGVDPDVLSPREADDFSRGVDVISDKFCR